MANITCFKAYDIRGRVPDQLNEDIAYRIGRAAAIFLQQNQPQADHTNTSVQAQAIVVGYDIRLSSPALSTSLIQGILDAGLDVLDIGLCGTEEVYFATSHFKALGGVCITASHNPKDYNGMKLVASGSRPISGDTGLLEIKQLAEQQAWLVNEETMPNTLQTPTAGTKLGGQRTSVECRPEFVQHLLSYVDVDRLKPLKIVCNAGNGGAGLVIDALEPHLPFEWIKLQHEPDGTFPFGVPNPLLLENRQMTSQSVIEHQADLGIAWDGDFDRCFFFDHNGRFIEGYYLVGLLAECFLTKEPGARIVHDPRLVWNTQEIVQRLGGVAIQNKTGHAFIKERMRAEKALYGGEMSAHHYFKDFFYSDSGMIPWLLIAEHISNENLPLAQMLDHRIERYPVSGELNMKVKNAAQVLQRLQERYAGTVQQIEAIDGLSFDFGQWRFNIRMSNTEPLLRLNIETRGDPALLKIKTQELKQALEEGNLVL
jgi:phosphomannomutase